MQFFLKNNSRSASITKMNKSEVLDQKTPSEYRALTFLSTMVKERFKDIQIDTEPIATILLQDLSSKDQTSYEEQYVNRKLNRWAEMFSSPCCEFMTSDLHTTTRRSIQTWLIQKTVPHVTSRVSDDVIRLIESHRGEISKIYQAPLEQGIFFLNNYVVRNYSYHKQIETKEHMAGVRPVALAVWSFDFQKAQGLINKVLKHDTQTILLKPIIKGFKNVVYLTKKDKQIEHLLLARSSFNILVPEQGTSNSKPTHSFNVLCADLTEQHVKEFLLLPKNRKLLILKQAIEFLIEISSHMATIPSGDPYFLALTAFLSNNIDRRDSNFDEMLNIEGLLPMDRFMLAHKFLCGKLNDFRKQFRQSIQKTSNLHNLIFCVTSKEKRNILQNYLDETSDLETVSYLSIFERQRYKDITVFDTFINQYRDCLRRGGNTRKLEFLARKQREAKDRDKVMFSGSSTIPVTLPPSVCEIDRLAHKQNNSLFFTETIDFSNQQLTESNKVWAKEADLCSVCTQIIKPDDDQQYIQCLKCKHGGHRNHLMSWFTHNQRCASNDCVCLCN